MGYRAVDTHCLSRRSPAEKEGAAKGGGEVGGEMVPGQKHGKTSATTNCAARQLYDHPPGRVLTILGH